MSAEGSSRCRGLAKIGAWVMVALFGTLAAASGVAGTADAQGGSPPDDLICTVAGTGVSGFNGDDIPSASAQLTRAIDVTVDGVGNLYIADIDNQRVRKVDATAGQISTVAGTGGFGFNGDGIPATTADLRNPVGVAVDGTSSVYVAESGNNRVRKVDAVTGLISTVAGTGVYGFNGDGIAATTAHLRVPAGIVVDGAGNIYIADQFNQRVRKVDAVTGLISTVAGTGVAGFNGDAIAATTAQLNHPVGVAIDGAGNVYIADSPNQRVRKVDAVTGLISTVAGTGVAGFNGDGIAATTAQLNGPSAVAVDGAGNVYIGDESNHRVRKVDGVTGLISTVAGTGVYGFNGDGIAATTAHLRVPAGIAVDGAGIVYIADRDNSRVRAVGATCLGSSPGLLTLTKIVAGAGEVTDFQLSATAKGDEIVPPMPEPCTYNQAIIGCPPGVDEALPFVSGVPQLVPADTYVLSETGPAGYSAGEWSCTKSPAGGGAAVVSTGSTVVVNEGDEVACEVTNTQDPTDTTLTIVKGVVGVAAPADFVFTVDPEVAGCSPSQTATIGGAGGMATVTVADIATGTAAPCSYSVVETAPPGYTAAVATISGVAADGTATFTNTQDPTDTTLTIVSGVAGGAVFTIRPATGCVATPSTMTMSGTGTATVVVSDIAAGTAIPCIYSVEARSLRGVGISPSGPQGLNAGGTITFALLGGVVYPGPFAEPPPVAEPVLGFGAVPPTIPQADAAANASASGTESAQPSTSYPLAVTGSSADLLLRTALMLVGAGALAHGTRRRIRR